LPENLSSDIPSQSIERQIQDPPSILEAEIR